jgi:glycosyltransferase involved in cell wall biosynthesis
LIRGVRSARASRLIPETDSAGVKVLLVGTGAYPIPPSGYGAVERILFEYGQALERAGHTVRILNEVHGSGSLAEYRFAFRVSSAVRREEYDIVHASTPVVANRLAGAGIPFVYTSHSRHWFWRPRWTHRWGFWLERRAVRRATAVVALTSAVEAAMRANAPFRFATPIRVIPYGVEAGRYAPSWESRTGRKALGVGLVRPLKRWEVAAAALKGTGISLRIVGPVPDAEYASRVRAAGENVELLGEVDEDRLRQMYAESDFLVHPSQVEVLPRAVLEAMASALPVVGSSVVDSLFPEGKGGLTAPPSATGADLVEFFRTSVTNLSANPGLRRKMGEEGQAAARETYSWDRIVAAHLELYRAVSRPSS